MGSFILVERENKKENEVYNQSPFKVHFDNIKPQYLGVNYNLVLRSSNFTIVPEKVKSIKKYNFSSLESEGISDSEFFSVEGDYSYGEWIDFDGCRFKITLNEEINEPQDNYYFNFHSYEELAQKNQHNIKVENLESNSNLLRVSLSGYNSSKITDYVNGICLQLQEYELNKKNLSVDNTISFLSEQILVEEEELENITTTLLEFLTKEEMLSLDQEGLRLLESIQKLELQRDELLNEKLYLHRYKENRVEHDSGKIMEIPAFIGMNHPELNQISNELIELNTTIDSYKNSLSSANPIAIDLTQRYSRLNELLNQSLDNAIELNSVLFDSLDTRMSNVLKEFERYPNAEQQLFILKVNNCLLRKG